MYRIRKKRIAISLAILVLLSGLVFWLVAPVDSPNVLPRLPFSNVAGLGKLEESAAPYQSSRAARESPADTAIVGSAHVFSCDEQTKPEASARAEDRIKELMAIQDQERVEVAASLMYSKDPEHLLMAALIESDRGSKGGLAAMENALAADPGNRLTLWNFLDTCSLHPEASACADGSIERRAILADGGNGRLWGKIVGYRLGRGDNGGALDALIKANTAPQFNDYWIEHVELLERGFAATTDYSFTKRIFQAIGETAIMTATGTRVFEACQEQAAELAEWLQECLEYGKRLEADGKTSLSIMIGLGLQRKMYGISGDTTKIAEADLRYRLINDAIMKLLRSNDELVLLHDENILADFIAEWSAHGEFRAMRFLQEAVIRLSQQPGFDPCKLLEAGKTGTND